MNVGSRLKTPVLPIWVTCVNHNWFFLFNPNRDLMKSYSAENRSSCLTVTCCSFLFSFASDSSFTTSAILSPRRRETPCLSLIPGLRRVFVTSMIMMRWRRILLRRLFRASKYAEICFYLSSYVTIFRWEGANVDWQGISRYV